MSQSLGWKSWRAGAHRLLMRWGWDTRKLRKDRMVLEQVIFPAIHGDSKIQAILFIGCAWYTLHYPWIFHDRVFHTLEIDPAAAKYGSHRHIVGSCESLRSHFRRQELDCIIMNGVFGFGLDTPEALDKTLKGVHQVLRVGGLFVFGWNNLPAHAPFPPDEVAAWEHFEPIPFTPLGAAIYHSDPINQHRFQFFANRPALEVG
jgi:hypothetical protein